MKTCGKCNEMLPFVMFGVDKQKSDGLSSSCKSCQSNSRAANREKTKTYAAKYREENKEKVKAGIAKWREENPEKRRAADAAWREANKDRKRVTNMAWRAANPDKAKAICAAWRESNPKKKLIHNQNRRSIKKAVGGKLSTGLAHKLYALQKGKCACCGQPLGDDFHLDHIMPLALGGTNTDDNVQLLRKLCNLQKHAKHPVDFMQQRGFLL